MPIDGQHFHEIQFRFSDNKLDMGSRWVDVVFSNIKMEVGTLHLVISSVIPGTCTVNKKSKFRLVPLPGTNLGEVGG